MIEFLFAVVWAVCIVALAVAVVMLLWIKYGDTVDRWLGRDERPVRDEADVTLHIYSSHTRHRHVHADELAGPKREWLA